MPQRDRRVVEDRGQRGGHDRPVEVERRRLGGLGQYLDLRLGELDAARRLRVRGHDAGHPDDRLLARNRAGLVTRDPPGATTWASPLRSLTTRKDTDFSRRRRCTQPAIVTRCPACSASSADRTREIITAPHELHDPLGVRGRRELPVPPHFRRRAASFALLVVLVSGSGRLSPRPSSPGPRVRRRCSAPHLLFRRGAVHAPTTGGGRARGDGGTLRRDDEPLRAMGSDRSGPGGR